MKDKVDVLVKDVESIKDAGFHQEGSVRDRVSKLESSLANIKKYEIEEIREILNTKRKRKITIVDGLIGGVC